MRYYNFNDMIGISKNQLKKQALIRGYISCCKCRATKKTLIKRIENGSKVYYCTDCLKIKE